MLRAYDAFMDWSEYVASRAEGRNQEEIALRVGVSQSSISRWKAGKGRPSAENAISFARATGDPPVAGLLAAGFLRHDEVDGVVRVATSLSDSATDALLTELGRRLGIHVSARGEASA